ncbi:MAG: universal stress protein [Desulfobacterales bacterium]|nr:universal stress protein [Desulfobacterales bacterium]
MVPRINHILYATDLSDGARRAMGYAVALANALEASLTVVHVIKEASPNAELLIQAFLGYSSKEEVKDKSRAQITEEIKERLGQMCDELGCQLPECRFSLADVIVDFGRPREMVLNHAKTGKYDVLVMGRHDYGLIETAFSGDSAKDLLRHSPIPVFWVPMARDTEPAPRAGKSG